MRSKREAQTEFAATLFWQSAQMMVGAEEPVCVAFLYP